MTHLSPPLPHPDFTAAREILFARTNYAANAAAPPIFQTSLFSFDTYEDMAAVFAGDPRLVYSRGDNPTVMEFESLTAALEGAEAGRAFSSGMAAIAAVVMAFVQAGDRVVTVRNVYSDAFKLFEKLLVPLGVRFDYIDGTDPEAVAAALPGSRLLYLENPTTLTFEEQDLSALTALARQHGVITAIDNSWATPLYQQPVRHGVDLVIHAASKYLGGYSDTVAGVVVGRKELIDRINGLTYPYLGAKLSPFEAFLLTRGLRSLPLRMPLHMAGGLEIAARLAAHDDVEQVFHPGLRPAGANRSLTGFGGVFSFEVSPAIDVPRFANALRHIRLGVSWGGPESLLVPLKVAVPTTPSTVPNPFSRFGISPRLIRLAVGLEPVESLWEDLSTALTAARI